MKLPDEVLFLNLSAAREYIQDWLIYAHKTENILTDKSDIHHLVYGEHYKFTPEILINPGQTLYDVSINRSFRRFGREYKECYRVYFSTSESYGYCFASCIDESKLQFTPEMREQFQSALLEVK